MPLMAVTLREIERVFEILDRLCISREAVVIPLKFEPYAPVRRQLFIILRAVNRARRAAGFTAVPWTALRRRRRIVKPFETLEAFPACAQAGRGG